MKLSVIVCTRNRAHAIIPCLDSIAQSLALAAPVEAEIVVVDNGSEDNTSTIVQDWASRANVPVKLAFEPKKGLANARNCGLRTAQGDLLVCTDDDCRLSEAYITDVLRHDAGDTEPTLRGGRVELGDPADLPISIKTDLTSKRWSKKQNSSRHEDMGFCIAGCNMAMRREVAERIGLFDAKFGAGSEIPAGEDTDYIFRAYLAGIAIEYVPDMVIHHFHGRREHAVRKQLMQGYMVAKGAVYAKHLFRHPNFCRPGYWQVKNAVREMLSGQNGSDQPNMSSKQIVMFNMLGAFKYYVETARQFAQGGRA